MPVSFADSTADSPRQVCGGNMFGVDVEFARTVALERLDLGLRLGFGLRWDLESGLDFGVVRVRVRVRVLT